MRVWGFRFSVPFPSAAVVSPASTELDAADAPRNCTHSHSVSAHASSWNSAGKESGRARLVGLPNLEEEGSDKLCGHGALINPLEQFANRTPVLRGAGGWASGRLEDRWGASFFLSGLETGYCGVHCSSLALPFERKPIQRFNSRLQLAILHGKNAPLNSHRGNCKQPGCLRFTMPFFSPTTSPMAWPLGGLSLRLAIPRSSSP